MKLVPYSEYKDSGVSWLGNIPVHWDSRKLRNILTLVSERNRPDLPLLSVVREKGVIKRNISSKEENHNYVPDDLSNYKVVRKSQFAMNKMKAWQGSYGISAFDGIVSPAYFVFDIDGAEGGFFHNAIRSKAYVPFFTQASDGVRVGQWDLNQTRMKEIPFFVPSPEEQTQIVRFLDWKTAQINKFIHNKRRLIELLKEQKQNIISQVVTKGVNPEVKLKLSGVKWIGYIPAHWETIKLRNLLKPISGRNRPDLPLLSVVREKGVIIRDVEDLEGNHNFIPDDLSNYKVVRKGQFAMNKMKAWQGSYGVSDFDGIVSPAYYVFEMLGKVTPRFFHVAIRSKAYVPFFTKASDGVRIGQWDLSIPRMKEIPFFIPSDEEQEEIVLFIEEQHSTIDKTIVRTEREIELMREYHTRLISDVVTGKVDVRGIKVPEIAEGNLLVLDEDNIDTDEIVEDDEVMDETY
jgi:type I restriction enzyme S subunit